MTEVIVIAGTGLTNTPLPHIGDSNMKARPILFSTPMVQALLDGRKTMTRRIVKGIPDWVERFGFTTFTPDGCISGHGSLHGEPAEGFFKLPYGQPGDLLWVREAWRLFESEECGCSEYPCGCPRTGTPLYRATNANQESKWKPSIHMARKYNRITLEITNIHIERLKSISEEDAKAEGIFFTDYGRNCFHGGSLSDVGDCPADIATHPVRPGWSWRKTTHQDQCLGSAKSAFSNLWMSINGPDSWEENPWVWCVEFSVHQVNVDKFINQRSSA